MEKQEDVCQLPNGCHLFREPNGVGGYRYFSDEIGCGIMVWDTCLVNESTLLAAIVEEKKRIYLEYQINKRLIRANKVWDILIKEGSALEDDRDNFIQWFKDSLPFCRKNSMCSAREFRFGGFLGFGGKIYFCNQMINCYVNCYKEDKDEKRINIIYNINKQLKEIH